VTRYSNFSAKAANRRSTITAPENAEDESSAMVASDEEAYRCNSGYVTADDVCGRCNEKNEQKPNGFRTSAGLSRVVGQV
jgi:hypothetical protein